MKIYNTTKGIIIQTIDNFFLSKEPGWDVFINRPDLFKKITGLSPFEYRNKYNKLGMLTEVVS